MGITDCSKHGYANFTEICPHVAAHVQKGRFGHFRHIDLWPPGLLVCDECFGKYDLARLSDLLGLLKASLLDEDAEKTYDECCEAYERFTDRQLCCDECIAAAQVSQARSDGAPDPFPVYERTLTSRQADTIREMESYLTRHFEFKASVVDWSRPRLALFLVPGHYRRPLTIQVYYVVTRAEQDVVAALVSRFLSGQALDQARVQFWEAEIWETGTNPETGYSWGRRGRETLLREEFVNRENERVQS